VDATGDGRDAVPAAGPICGSCGAELPPDSRFCNKCGAPVRLASTAAEYKQVTVLFADVVRSMDIAAAVDMERLREIMTEVVERAAAMVRRYGGTVEYYGDGLMALFGAPIALEDHAFRACLAALAVQEETKRLAAKVARRDGVALRLRVGLNSGRVIAGDIGSGSLRYAATGEPVGFAERMQSVAPPGGVMLSESTARLVEHTATLAEPEWVHIKGANEPVRARRLVAINPRDTRRAEAGLVGRRWEMAALEAMADRASGGHGGVVIVAGPPGIGKSRTAREVAALAAGRGFEVSWAFCESHAREVPFYVVTRLLRASMGVGDLDDLDDQAARARVRQQLPDADPQDGLLLDDLLGIADPGVALRQIDPDARRRRLTALINTTLLARTQRALLIVEDAHWIDAASESMIAEMLTAIPHTRSMMLITARPDYRGGLTKVPGAQTIALAPLDDSDTAALLGELVGPDPSVGELTSVVAKRAAGNPFFAEEMVREFAQRGVLVGERGHYLCHADVDEVSVPATVQAAIAARIDPLTAPAKRALNAAAVIGDRFDAALLSALGIDAVLEELLSTELIDQVRFTPTAEYAFRHPLIRAVAYESQLKYQRAELHRRLAAAIEQRAPGAVEGNAAAIAEHLLAGGELHAAYDWHMRAAAWASMRDIDAARVSWERARRIADALPADDPGQLSMRIATRTMLCATVGFGPAVAENHARFAELRELCSAAGDKASLAIAMYGVATELLYTGRLLEGSRLASEQMAVLESIGDPTLIMGLAFVAFCNWLLVGKFGEILRWSQIVIDLAAGDPAKGAGFGFGSPLAIALAFRGSARWWLGRPGWRQDLHDAVAMAQNSDPTTFAAVVNWTYGSAMHYGVLRVDDAVLRLTEEAVVAAGSSNWAALLVAEVTLGFALWTRDAAADRRRALDLLVQFREVVRERVPVLTPLGDMWLARERAESGDRDTAIAVMRQTVDELHRASHFFYEVWGTGVLVEALLERGAEAHVREAEETIDRLANQWADDGSPVREITLLRLRALLAAARHDDAAYRELVSRYRGLATGLGFEGHIAWAEAMPAVAN
jgi:class 3 adenylate cyclase